jgi:hypothetical protein
MLTVFRSDLPGGSGPAGDSFAFKVGTFDVELEWLFGDGRCGSADDDTARLAVEGDGRNELGEGRDAGLALDDRDLATGRAGRGPVGGAMDGREGRGRVVMVSWIEE